MAIGVRTRPEFTVTGAVSRTAERYKKDDGAHYATDVVVDTNGGGVYVRIWARDLEHLPSVGEYVALVVTADEGQQASLNFVRRVTANDLDLIVSASGLAVASK